MEPGDAALGTRPSASPPPEKLRWGRGVIVGLNMILGLVAIAAIALLVFTGTDFGRERVRRYAESFLNGMIHGQARIGRLSGNLLTGMTVHNVTIRDSTGQPFVAVESFSGDYAIMSLLRKRIWIQNAVLVRPLIVLDRPPDGTWNWQRIFPRDTTPKPASQQQGWLDWLRFTNAQVVDGNLIVRTPWHPSEALSKQAQDSAIRDVLGGGSRLMVQRARGGFQKIVELRSITAKVPLLRLSEPGVKDRLAQISALQMQAFPFREPGADVRDLKGTFPFNNDSVWWHGVYASLPDTRINGDGSYSLNSGDMTLKLHSPVASFADLRWLYPRLPSNGKGHLDFNLTWKGALQDYLAYNADVTMGEAHATGSFGITLGDTLTFHDTNLRFTGIDTRQVEQLVPGFIAPRRGVLAGRASLHGGKHALAVNGDVTFSDRVAGTSHVIAAGEVGFLPGGLRARDLRLEMLPLQVELARQFLGTAPISGVVTGTALINGSTNTELAITGDIDHRDRGTRSVIGGKALVRLAGVKRFDVDVTARPVSLVEVGRFFPAVGLQGSAAGPIKISGTLADLRVNADLRLPDGGRFVADGTLGLTGRDKRYDLTARLHTFNARTVLAKAPRTSLTARAMVRGAGTDLATMHAVIAADLSTSTWDTVGVDTASVRATIGSGLATVERLEVRGSHTVASAAGAFGLTRGRSGELTYRVAVDSLGAYNRWLPKTAADTGRVPPRPLIVARALRKARADSARLDKATEVERIATGKPAPKLNVQAAPPPVPRDTISGSLAAAGTLRGNIYDFDLRGRAAGENVVARGNFARRFRSEYAWMNARTPKSQIAVGFQGDSVSTYGFAFDTVDARVSYQRPGGHVEVVVRQGPDRDYALKGDYAINAEQQELRLANMTLRFDTALWTAPHPATVEWGGPGIRVTNFELRNRGNGRVYANGLLPTQGVADFSFAVDNFPVTDIIDLVQTDLDLTGSVTVHGSMSGTMAAPAFKGAFGAVNATYNGTKVPELRGTFGYAERQLVTHVEALRNGGRAMATVDGRLPINLALSGVTGPRLLPDAIALDLVADSLPVELIPSFTDIVSNVHGLAAARIAMRGTLKRPSLTGAMFIDHGTVTLNPTGATIDNLAGSIRMANDTVYVDSLVGTAKGPVRVRGEVAVGTWREPSFNLFLVADGAQLLNSDKWGRVKVEAGLALTGPFKKPYLSGQVNVIDGVFRAPEATGKHIIGSGDPDLFNVLDTAMIADKELFPASSPMLANLRVEVALNIHRNTWVRNQEANIEVYTDYPLMVRAEQEALALTGTVATDRGEYTFMSKRFQVKRGSALFIGSPDLNPTLQVTGEYAVQIASQGALNIRVVIGGTLIKPKLSLESDAQPPRSQSELLSMLAFGQSTTSLTQLSGSSLTGSPSGGDLFGVGAQLAVKRLAGVALGVAVQQVQIEAGKAFGTDVFNITPGDVPVELAQGRGFGNFFTQTRIEAGRYVNPRTFVSGQEEGGVFGAAVQHRTSDGWQFTASFEPRFLLREPTLSTDPQANRVRSYGGFIVREWRF